jgi:hypothetical protein
MKAANQFSVSPCAEKIGERHKLPQYKWKTKLLKQDRREEFLDYNPLSNVFPGERTL